MLNRLTEEELHNLGEFVNWCKENKPDSLKKAETIETHVILDSRNPRTIMMLDVPNTREYPLYSVIRNYIDDGKLNDIVDYASDLSGGFLRFKNSGIDFFREKNWI